MATKKRLHQTFDEVQEILDSVPSMTNVQADWNENNTTKDDYIKNRTHWDGPGRLTNTRLSWTGSTLTQDMPFVLSGTGSNGTQSFNLVNSFWDTASVLPNGSWMVEIAGHTWKVDIMYRDLYVTMDDNDVFSQRFRSGTGTITATSPVYLNTSIPIVAVHKLDNKYLDLDSTPTQDSGKPITSGGVYEALEDVAIIGDEIGSTPVPGVDFNAYTDTVWNKPQTLSPAQQSQIQTNLGIGTGYLSINDTLIADGGGAPV